MHGQRNLVRRAPSIDDSSQHGSTARRISKLKFSKDLVVPSEECCVLDAYQSTVEIIRVNARKFDYVR